MELLYYIAILCSLLLLVAQFLFSLAKKYLGEEVPEYIEVNMIYRENQENGPDVDWESMGIQRPEVSYKEYVSPTIVKTSRIETISPWNAHKCHMTFTDGGWVHIAHPYKELLKKLPHAKVVETRRRRRRKQKQIRPTGKTPS